MEIATFIKYDNGYYTFDLESIGIMVFEEAHPKVLSSFNLKNDTSLRGKRFQFNFSEHIEDDDEDFVFYRIETLKLL